MTKGRSGGRRARGTRSPLAAPALRSALACTLVLAMIAIAAGGVRLLPWLLDPDVPWRVARPFARSVTWLALEAALLVGWPLGWALAAFALVERGEARVLASLGESPATTVRRLAPTAAAFFALVFLVSSLGARDASEPGRVLGELLDQGRAACVASTAPATFAVPFVGATWLCAPGEAPRLVGRPLGALGGTSPSRVVYTARNARFAKDLGELALDDAWLHVGPAHLQTRAIVVRGLPRFTQGAGVRPIARALAVALGGAIAAIVAVWLALQRSDEAGADAPHRLHAIAIGVAGPLAVLALLRAVDRVDPTRAAFLSAIVPVAAAIAAFLVTVGVAQLVRRAERLRVPLRRWRVAASKRG